MFLPLAPPQQPPLLKGSHGPPGALRGPKGLLCRKRTGRRISKNDMSFVSGSHVREDKICEFNDRKKI